MPSATILLALRFAPPDITSCFLREMQAEEALGADHRGEFRLQNLDGDLTIVLEILGETDRSHAACAEFPLDAVAVGKGGGEAVHASVIVARPLG